MKFKTPDGKNIEITEEQIEQTEQYREKTMRYSESKNRNNNRYNDPSVDDDDSMQKKLERSASGGFAGIYGSGLAVISSALKNADLSVSSVSNFGADLSQKARLEMEQDKLARRAIRDIMEHIHNINDNNDNDPSPQNSPPRM